MGNVICPTNKVDGTFYDKPKITLQTNLKKETMSFLHFTRIGLCFGIWSGILNVNDTSYFTSDQYCDKSVACNFSFIINKQKKCHQVVFCTRTGNACPS